jgi:phosphoenolpyruvate synthase/pyruvate phosphate dikinase
MTPWEPFVHAVVRAQGATFEGQPAAPGAGAGVLCFVQNPHAPAPDGLRPVLVAERPLPGLAPLLWNAAGLVIGSGNPAAHLLEVAHSVGVPAVVGVDVERLVGAADGHAAARAPLVAVDGNAGDVAVIERPPGTVTR